MKLSGSLLLAMMLVAVSALVTTQAQAGTIDFTTLPPGDAVTNQFSGVVFSLMGGNDSDGPPTTSWLLQDTSLGGLTNTVDAGFILPTAEFLVATFSVPVTGVEFSFWDGLCNGGNSYTLYDASGNVITSALMPEASLGSYTYNLSSYTGVSEIAWDNGLGSDFTLLGYGVQDLQSLSFTPAACSTPEPSTWVLLGSALIGLRFLRRKRA
jgi:hypothetical protein